MFASKSALQAWKDRALAAESRERRLLDRLASEGRPLILGDPQNVHFAPSTEPLYIPDTPEADAAWNEYRGEPDDEEPS